MDDARTIFIRTKKITKLVRRLDHQRRGGLYLDPRSTLAFMNERAVMEMEKKLFRFKNSRLTTKSTHAGWAELPRVR